MKQWKAGDHQPNSLIDIYFILSIIFFNAKAKVAAWPFNITQYSVLTGYHFLRCTLLSGVPLQSYIMYVITHTLYRIMYVVTSNYTCDYWYFKTKIAFILQCIFQILSKVPFTYRIYIFSFLPPTCICKVNSNFWAFSLALFFFFFNLAEKVKNKYIILHWDVQKMFCNLECLLLCIASFWWE